MMKKANKQSIKKANKRDYLKLTAISLLVIALVTSIYVWWNPSSPLNTISTAATSLFYSAIIIPITLIGVLFYILMLIDSWKNNRFIWFLFILLGPGIIALIYFFVYSPKLPRKYLRPVAWVAIILFVVLWAPAIFWYLRDRINPFDVSKLTPTGREIKATIITKDLKGYKYEGTTTCREMTWDNKYYVELVGGTLTVPKDRSLRFNYSFSTGSNGFRVEERGSGNESFDGQPTSVIDVPSLVGEGTEINKNLTNCQFTFWSTKN